MDKAIVTVFLMVIGIVAALFLFNSVLPAVVESSAAMSNMTARMDQRLKSQVEVIHGAGELDSAGSWQDSNGNGTFDVFVWVKNIGSTRIIPVERNDIFFGPEGNFARIPHQSEAGGSYPYWTGQVENDSQWTPTATLRVTIHFGAALTSGRYFFKLNTPNGVSSQIFLGL